MFNVGGGELIVIMLIALIVLGPQRLPGAARQIGKALSDLRRLSTGFQNEVRTALNEADDLDQVSARRNVLARDGVATTPLDADHGPEAPARPVRTRPLQAAPLDETVAATPPAEQPLDETVAPTSPAEQPTAEQPTAEQPTTTKKATKAKAPRAGA